MTIELSEYVIDAIADAIAQKLKYIPYEHIEPIRENAHWIKRRDEETPTYYYQCDMCLGYSDCDSDYCPDCGRRMVEEE